MPKPAYTATPGTPRKVTQKPLGPMPGGTTWVVNGVIKFPCGATVNETSTGKTSAAAIRSFEHTARQRGPAHAHGCRNGCRTT